jgi:hypothetical protein
MMQGYMVKGLNYLNVQQPLGGVPLAIAVGDRAHTPR